MSRHLKYAFQPHNTRPDSFSTPSHHTTQVPTASLRLPITQHKTRQLQYAFPAHNSRPDSFSTPSHHTAQKPTASSRLSTTQSNTRQLQYAFAPQNTRYHSTSFSIFYLKAKINKKNLIRVNKGNNKITELRNDIYIIRSFVGGLHVAHISLVFCVVFPCAFTF